MATSTTTVSEDGTAKLIFRNGPCRGRVILLDKERLAIGRNRQNDLVIDMGMIVSSFHAAVVRDPEDSSWWIEDLTSKNGTYLNGDRVSKSRLCEGDVVGLALTGPELQFTSGVPQLPGFIETTISLFRRTSSVETAIRELLPYRRSEKERVSLSGVHRKIESHLETVARRTRWVFLVSAASVLLLLGGFLALGIVNALGDLRRGGALPPATPHAAVVAAPAPPLAPVVELVPELEPIYGSLFLSYRDNPVGRVEVFNQSDATLEGALLEFGFKKLTGDVDLLVEPYREKLPTLAPGERIAVDLLPKLSNAILASITREVTAEIRVVKGSEELARADRAVFIHGRNVFNWEKPERITAFVDPQDVALREFMDAVWRESPKGMATEFPPQSFRWAVALITALADLRLVYLPDAQTPISAKVDWMANDRVNYPWETLIRRTGDCDDLSVLVAAVLERAQIPTAIAIGPQHVLVLFDTGIGVERLSTTPLDPENVVVWRDRVWIPLETTVLGRPGGRFESAWGAGWVRRDAILGPDMQIVEVREGWKEYLPMNPEPDERTLRKLDAETWVQSGLRARVEETLANLDKLFRASLEEKVEEIKASEAPGRTRQHALGQLYASSGLLRQAAQKLWSAIFAESEPSVDPGRPIAELLRSFPPDDGDLPYLLFDYGVCLTLGALAPQDYERAAICYRVALERLPEHGAFPGRGDFLLHLALAYHLKGDLAEESHWREIAYKYDPTLRQTYRELIVGTGARAGENELIRRHLLDALLRRKVSVAPPPPPPPPATERTGSERGSVPAGAEPDTG